MLVALSAGLSAFAKMDDAPVSDLVFVCENTDVKVGDLIEVKVFINNISLEDGIIACDLPLFYDSEALELSYQDAIIPQSWGTNYSFLFSPNDGTGYCWLRVVPDVPLSEELDFYKYTVTEDDTLGFILVFTAKKTGDTSLEIKHKADENVYMMMVSPELENFPPNGAKLDISVGDGQGAESTESGENSASAESSEVEESDVSEESSKTEESGEAAESSAITENSEAEESSGAIGSTDAEESVAPDNADGNSASASTDSSSDEDGFPYGLVIAIAGAVLVIGGVVLYFILRKKNG